MPRTYLYLYFYQNKNITVITLNESKEGRYNEFRIFYNHTIHPELVRLERKRLRLLAHFAFSFILIIGLFIIGLWLDVMVITLGLMLFIGIYIFILYQKVKKFVLTFKPNIVNLLTDFIDNGINYGDLIYSPNKFIPKSKFMSSDIFHVNPDLYQGEDYLKGTIGDVPFEMCELNVREESKVRQRLNYVFKGVFLCATIQHPIKGRILVLPQDFRQYLTRTTRAFTMKGGRPSETFLRNEEFKEIWMTYAFLESSLKTVLSDDMQQRLVDYYNKTEKPIYLSFQGNKIFIAITEEKDILEPYIFKSNVSFELVRQYYEDLTLLLEIVEDFDANH